MNLMPDIVLVQAEPEKIAKTNQALINGMIQPAVFDIRDEHTLKSYDDIGDVINKNIRHLMEGRRDDGSIIFSDNIVSQTNKDGSQEYLDMVSYIAF